MNELCQHSDNKDCITPCPDSLEEVEPAERIKGRYIAKGIAPILTREEKNRVLAMGLRV